MPSGPDAQPIRILHLSDFHFSERKAWDADPVMGQLAEHIGQEVAGGMVPDLVAITGDLAFSGRAVEYERAGRWLEYKLWPVLGGLAKDRLLLVPGNHDVNRSAIKRGALALHGDFLDGADQQAIAEVLQDPEERAPLLRRHTDYLAFRNAWYGADLAVPWWQRSLAIRGHRLHLVGFDSAWLAAGSQDYGRLLLSRYQLHRLLFPGGEEPALRIALLHHPWSYLAEFDGSEAEALIHLKCDLVLRGHLHRPRSERILPPDPDRACLELAAGCVYEDGQYPNAYHWIELWPGDKARVHFRTWQHQQWIPDRNVPGTTNAEAVFRLAPESPEPAPAEPPSFAPPRFQTPAEDAAQPFHVFLSHNSRDKPQVGELARRLKTRGLRVWLDEEQLPPGVPWQPLLEQGMEDCRSGAVLVGNDGFGPWEDEETQALLRLAVSRGQPVIPVLLPGAPLEPRLPMFLSNRTWVDLRGGYGEEGIARLVWGITGQRPRPGEGPVTAGEIRDYRAWAEARYQGVELIGVGGGALSLDFDQVYIPLAIARRDPLAEGEFDKRGHSRQALVQQAALEEIGVADIFTRAPQGQPHGAVFGIPGCGKTTVLLKLLHLCLRQDPKELGLAEQTLPLFLPLAQLDRQAMLRDQPLGPILGQGLDLLAGPGLPKGLGERLWERGRLLLLLDGLDEVADEGERAQVAAYLVKALTSAGGHGIRALVACRIDSYGGAVRLPGFLPLDVQPLDDPRIERFVDAWLGEAHRVRGTGPKLARLDAERQTGQLVSALKGKEYASQQLKTLVSNPLMLTLLCLVVLKGGRLPHNRGEFYRRCLDALLTTWGQGQGRRPCPLPEDGLVLAVLRPLARKLHSERRKYDLAPAQFIALADRVLKPRGLQDRSAPLLEWLHKEAGVLSEYAPRRYGFMHLGFQEYLCAESFEAADTAWLDSLLDQLADVTGLDWWREVILLLASLPDSAPFAKLVAPLLAPGAARKDLLRACLVESPALDLSPFLAVLDGAPGPAIQALVLELLAGRTDPELLERARTLAESADSRVAQLAQRLLQRQIPAAAEGGWDLLLLHTPEDQTAAARLGGELRSAGLRPWLAAERLAEGRTWQDTRVLQELLKLALPVLVLAQAGRPWEDQETLDALQLFAERKISLLGTGQAAGAPTSLLPPSAWLADDRRLPEVLAARLADRPRAQIRSRGELRPLESVVTGPRPGEPYTEPHTGLRLLWIPGGSFAMGSDQISEDETPIHRVRISPFRLAETPVTNRQYALFLEATSHEEPAYWRDRRFSDPEQPVVGVSWDDAQTFCAWLAKHSGLAVTLPSEAQWELAARGEDGRTYPWGSQPPTPELACFDQDWGKGKPNPVGNHPAGRGPFGTLDQAGNVWEWCLDVWDETAYRKRAGAEPLDPVATTGDRERRVLRGGGWLNPAGGLRASLRFGLPAGLRRDLIGFRVAVAPASLGS